MTTAAEFLRVLLHLTMHDYPPLVSGALQLLFLGTSVRDREVLQAFKQVAWVVVCAHVCVCVGYGGGVVICLRGY